MNGAIVRRLAVDLPSLGPRYLTAPEVSMFTILEVVMAPLLVWAVPGANPGPRSLIGGVLIVSAIFAHTLWRLRQNRTVPA